MCHARLKKIAIAILLLGLSSGLGWAAGWNEWAWDTNQPRVAYETQASTTLWASVVWSSNVVSNVTVALKTDEGFLDYTYTTNLLTNVSSHLYNLRLMSNLTGQIVVTCLVQAIDQQAIDLFHAIEERQAALDFCAPEDVNFDFYREDYANISKASAWIKNQYSNFVDVSVEDLDAWFSDTNNIEPPRMTIGKLEVLADCVGFFSDPLSWRDTTAHYKIRRCLAHLYKVIYPDDFSLKGVYSSLTENEVECTGVIPYSDAQNWYNEKKARWTTNTVFIDIFKDSFLITNGFGSGCYGGSLFALSDELCFSQLSTNAADIGVSASFRSDSSSAEAIKPVLYVQKKNLSSLELYVYQPKMEGDCFTDESLISANATNGRFNKKSMSLDDFSSPNIGSEIITGCKPETNVFISANWFSSIETVKKLVIKNEAACRITEQITDETCTIITGWGCDISPYECPVNEQDTEGQTFSFNLFVEPSSVQRGYWALLHYAFEYE